MLNNQKNNNNKKKATKPGNKNRVVGDLVVYHHPRGIPYPQRYRTSHRIAIQGNIAPGQLPAVYRAYSAMYLPFSGGAWPGVLTSSISTLQPAGYSNLCASAGPYQSYRLLSSTARIRMVSGAASDQVTYTLTPLIGTLPAPSGVPDVLAEARTISAMTQGGSQLTTLKNTAKTSTIFGVQPQSVMNDVSGIFGASYNSLPTATVNWFVCWTTSSGLALTASMSYEMEMHLDVEYYQLNAGALLDN